jgi:hypothetical protein
VEPEQPPLDATELAALGNDAIVEHLRRWKPAERIFGGGPTIENQAAALREATTADPERFTAAAMSFADLDPTYVHAILTAVAELMGKDALLGIAWDRVFELARSALSHSAPDQPMTPGIDPGWGWTKKQVADLLRDGLGARPRRLPYDRRDQIRELIEQLSGDTHARAMNGDDEEARDAVSVALNTTRGSALLAAIDYMCWVFDETGSAAKDAGGMQLVPEIRGLLEQHIDATVDRTVAARGAFGYYLPRLLRCDLQWTIAQREQLFPPEDPLASVLTWQAYVYHNHVPPPRAIDIFADAYRRAIERISSSDADPRTQINVDEALATQLAHAFIRGWIGLESPDGLMPAFFAKAPARIRGHLIEELGRILEATSPEVLTREHCERVRALCGQRHAATAALDLAEARRELEAFGWVYVAGRCDEQWMLNHLLAVIALTGSIEPDSKVMDKLAALAPASPLEAVLAVDLLTENPKERWFVQAALEEIQTILRAGLADKRSREAARKVVNRLYADGQGAGVAQLLEEPSANT